MRSIFKLKKSILIPLIILVLLALGVVGFLIVGNVSLKLTTSLKNLDETIVIPINSEDYSEPEVKCEFFGKDISNKIINDKKVDLSILGEQTVEYKCNEFVFSKKIQINYEIVDNLKPELTLNGNSEVSVYLGDQYKEQGATAKDNVDGDLTDKITIEGSVDSSVEGSYDIKYVVVDSSGNESSVSRVVTVKKKPNPSSCGEAGVIYLTFDDGPNSLYTPVILDVLKKYDVKATFFVTNAGPDSLIKREAEEGHAVGLHSASHAYEKIYVSTEAFWADLNTVRDRVINITGQTPNLYRFPGGSSNTVSRKYKQGIMTQLAKEVEDAGYGYFDWNLSSGDAGGTTDPEVEYLNVVNSLSKSRGNVILMHDIKKHTSLAIENIVKYGLDHGYKFDVLNKDIVCHQTIHN